MLLTYLWKKVKLGNDEEGKVGCCLVWGMLSFILLVLFISNYPKFIPIWVTIVVGLILMETLFWISPIDNKKLSAKKPNKKQQKRIFNKTILLKLDCLYVVFLSFTAIIHIIVIIPQLTIELFLKVLKFVGYFGGSIVALGIITYILYLWIKLNERKFKQ